jgi:hypothetical protein
MKCVYCEDNGHNLCCGFIVVTSAGDVLPAPFELCTCGCAQAEHGQRLWNDVPSVSRQTSEGAWRKRKQQRHVDVRQATHVKDRSGKIEKITETWGIDEHGRMAKPSEGGFGVVTESGQRVGMMDAMEYLREDAASDLPPLYAWVGMDEYGSGQIGLKQGVVPAGTIPMVVVDRDLAKLEKYWPQAEEQARRYNTEIYLVRYWPVEVVRITGETVKPS